MSHSILAVASDRNLLDRLGPLLSRAAFEVNEMPTGEASLILTDQRRYNLLLVGYPLPDMDLESFLSAVHRNDSPCADTPVMIFSEKDRLSETEAFVESGYVQVVSTSDDGARLQRVASRLLEVPPRIAVRAMVRLGVALQGTAVQLCQTRNISATGMFIGTERFLDVGTTMQAELSLPDDSRPIHAEVEVTRRSIPKVEGFTGFGVRFLNIDPGGASRLQRYLDALDQSAATGATKPN